MISKPRARHELLEALRDEAGCALCFLATRAAGRYIEAILYESVTDVETRETDPSGSGNVQLSLLGDGEEF